MRHLADLLAPAVRRELDALAAAHPQNRWPLDADISLARNKHRTDSIATLRGGLVGPFDWLEGDIRLRGRVPVLAHDRDSIPELTLHEWLEIGAAAQRGLKLDVKLAAAVLPSVELALASGVDHRRLLFNLNVVSPREPTPMETLLRVRELAPDVLLNLSPGTYPYSRDVRERLLAIAREVGGPVMYALNDSWVRRHIVHHMLSEGGRVAIWNDPRERSARSIPRRVRTLRHWGVNGVVDLRGQPHNAAVGVRAHVAVAIARTWVRERRRRPA